MIKIFIQSAIWQLNRVCVLIDTDKNNEYNGKNKQMNRPCLSRKLSGHFHRTGECKFIHGF